MKLQPQEGKRACMLAYTSYETDNRVMRYAEALAESGYTVDVVAARLHGQPRCARVGSAHLFRLQWRRHRERTSKGSYLFRLVRFVIVSGLFTAARHVKSPYRLIHVHSMPDFLVLAALIPRLLGARVILDIHDLVPELFSSRFSKGAKAIVFPLLVIIERISAALAHHVIVANHLWQRTLVNRSVPASKCSVVMNYPDERFFYRRDRKISSEKFIIIYPGTLSRHQGVDIAVRAMHLIRHQVPEAELHIYGRGPDRSSLETLIRHLALEDRVVMKEMVPIWEIAEAMSQADLGVVPKRNDCFGDTAFSTKSLEFLALGVPVVMSATQIDRHYFDSSFVEFFEPGSETSLAARIISLYQRKSRRQEMKEKSASFAEMYSWRVHRTEYLDLVRRLLTRNRSSGPQSSHS